MSGEPFYPRAASVAISGTTSASAAAALGSVAANQGGAQMRVVLKTSAAATVVFVAFGEDNTVAASLTPSQWNIPFLPGTIEVLSVSRSMTYVSAITDTGTCTVYVTPGLGA